MQFRIRADFNAEEQEGLGTYQVAQKNGERWSAARGYIHPFLNSSVNLRVETNTHATRILFEGKRAGLAKHGIASVHHLPGVGQNLQDHPDFVFGFTSDAPYFAGLSFGGVARIVTRRPIITSSKIKLIRGPSFP